MRRRRRPRDPQAQPLPIYDQPAVVDKHDDKAEKKDDKREVKTEKKDDKREYKITKINSKAQLLEARAGCFKWAAILLAIAAGVFFYLKGKLPI